MDKKRSLPKRAANGKKKIEKPSNKRAKKDSENKKGDHDGITGHMDDDVTVALPHEDGAAHQLDIEDVKIIKPTTPKLTEQQLMDALLLPSADIPTKSKTSSSYDLIDSDLPLKYAQLKEFFNALLNVYLCLQARKQSCTWSLMKEPIESMCNSISQMQTVIPNAFKLSVWKHTTTNKLGREVVVEIVSPSTSQPLNHLVASQLRETFSENLLQLVNQHHTTFLAAGKRKRPKAPARWHSQFNLESVPDIPLTPLPSALTEIPQQENPNKEVEKKLDASTVDKYIEAKPVPAELAGVSLATIAAARETEEAIESESEEVQLLRLLPVVARTMNGLCVCEKRRAFQRAHLVAQVVRCAATPLSIEEVVQAFERLAKVVPLWMSTYHADDGVEWVRVSRDVKLAECLVAIQKEIQQINVH